MVIDRVPNPDQNSRHTLWAKIDEIIDALNSGGGGGGAPPGNGFAHVTGGVFDPAADLSGDVTTSGGLATVLAKALRNPLGEMLEIFASSAAGSNYGNTNADIASPATAAPIGLAYVPLVEGASDYVVLEFISSYTGTIELVMMFAMGSGNTGVVALRCDVLKVHPVALGAGSGGNPTTNWTPGTPGVITPGNDALAHICASADFAGFAITGVQRGDFITAIVQRPAGLASPNTDTHTGDLRILKFGVRAV